MKKFVKLSLILVGLVAVCSCSKKNNTPAPLVLNSVSRSADTVGATVTCLGENLLNSDGKVILSYADQNVEANVFEPSASAFKFIVPEIAPAKYKLSYMAAGRSSNEMDFQVNPSFKVFSVSVDRSNPGAEIEIRGKNFYGSAGTYKVEFKSGAEIVPAAVKEISKTSIKTDVPSDLPTGLYTLSVSSGSESEDTYHREGELELKVSGTLANPSITFLSSASGFAGDVIRINGSNFSEVSSQNKVYLIIGGEQTEAEITESSSSYISFKVPQTAGKDNIVTKILVRVYDFIELSTNDNSFTVRKPLYISAIEPNTGKDGDTVKIHFANIDGLNASGKTAKFGNHEAAITNVAANSMNVKIPQADEGDYDVKITMSGEEATSTSKFRILSSKPIIESWSPIKTKPGYTVTLTGKNFSTVENRVYFMGDKDRRATITSMTATELKIITPNFIGDPGFLDEGSVYKTYKIVVRATVDGSEKTSDEQQIEVTDKPYIISVTPTTSKMGDTIMIKGFNFNPSGIDGANFPVVTFSKDSNTGEVKGLSNPDLTVVDDETIRVKVPSSGSMNVLWNSLTVKTADGKVSNVASIDVKYD
ncbi:MAG: IPT/TIG domain-containing protein [Prevotellaceae bacterium]|jgi:hypothetical protein|nr:IPT/TIG domain-containing protein [Prevotellaceae bacterium]